MAADAVLYAVRDGVGTITLNRPAVLNALDMDLTIQLAEAAGRAFSSGMDRTALSAGQVAEPFFRNWNRALSLLEDMPKVVVAVCHGYCIGGGLQLAVACDLRLAAEDCVLGLGATEHGLVPDGSILRLARIVGLGRAKELTLLNDWLRADEARAMGLVNWVVPAAELDTKLAAVVGRALESSRTANGHAKRLLHESFHTDPRAMLEEVLRAQADCMASPEMEEANRAWVEKRPARYFRPGP